MPIISIDVPAGVGGRVAAAFIALYPPPADTPVGTAAEKNAYIRSLLMDHIRSVVRSHEAAVAAEAARVTAAATADTDIVLT